MSDPYHLSLSAARHEANEPRGLAWSVRLRLPWFRALPLSSVENVVLSFAQTSIPLQELLIRVDDRFVAHADLRTMSDRYWPVDDELQVGVRPGPTAPAAGAVITVELTLRMPEGRSADGNWRRRTVRASAAMVEAAPRRWPLGVCTFSFAGELRRGRSLRSCLQEVSATGFTALEVLGAQVIPGYPAPASPQLDEFSRLVRESGLTPVCYDAFIDPGRRVDGDADAGAVLRWAENELDVAAALGCTYVRLNAPLDRRLLEQLATAAERRELVVLTELHARTAHDADVQTLLALLRELRSSRLGLVLDLSCVMRSLPAGYVGGVLRAGISQKASQIIESAWRKGLSLPALRAALDQLEPTRRGDAVQLAERTYALFRRSDPGWLPEVLPDTRIVHAKFFDVSTGEEPAIPYREVFDELARGGFEGYVMSEYEGHLWSGSPDTFGQLSNHRRLISGLSVARA
jgi:hypothetical protein